MRHRIKKLTMENQRQKATIDMLHIRMSNTEDDGSGAKLGGQLAMASSSGSFVEGAPAPATPDRHEPYTQHHRQCAQRQVRRRTRVFSD